MFDLASVEWGLMFDSDLQNTCDKNDWGEDYVGYDNDPFHGVKEYEINKNTRNTLSMGVTISIWIEELDSFPIQGASFYTYAHTWSFRIHVSSQTLCRMYVYVLLS